MKVGLAYKSLLYCHFYFTYETCKYYLHYQSRPNVHFCCKRKAKKGTLEHFKHVISICPNREHISKNRLRNSGRRYWKYRQFYGYRLTRLVCRAKDKTKKNILAEADIDGISLFYIGKDISYHSGLG